jgi:hypothetical protein
MGRPLPSRAGETPSRAEGGARIFATVIGTSIPQGSTPITAGARSPGPTATTTLTARPTPTITAAEPPPASRPASPKSTSGKPTMPRDYFWQGEPWTDIVVGCGLCDRRRGFAGLGSDGGIRTARRQGWQVEFRPKALIPDLGRRARPAGQGVRRRPEGHREHQEGRHQPGVQVQVRRPGACGRGRHPGAERGRRRRPAVPRLRRRNGERHHHPASRERRVGHRHAAPAPVQDRPARRRLGDHLRPPLLAAGHDRGRPGGRRRQRRQRPRSRNRARSPSAPIPSRRRWRSAPTGWRPR